MSSNINNFVRPTENADRKDINRILDMIHDLVSPEPEDEGVNERVMLRDHIRVKTNTVTIAGPDLLDSDTKARRNFIMRRKMPETVKSYPLVHTENSFGGITFPKLDTKLGCRIDFDGTGFISIADNSILKPTNKITIIGWFYLIKTATTQHLIKMQVANTVYNLRISNTDQLKIRVRTDNAGGTTYDKDIETANWTDSQWNHITATWSGTPDNRLRIYLNKIKEGADITTAGILQYAGTDGLGIGAGPLGGSNKSTNGTRMALLSILNQEFTQAQIDTNFDGIIETKGNNEITTIPFLQSARPKPNATSGLCRST